MSPLRSAIFMMPIHRAMSPGSPMAVSMASLPPANAASVTSAALPVAAATATPARMSPQPDQVHHALHPPPAMDMPGGTNSALVRGQVRGKGRPRTGDAPYPAV